VAGTVSTQIISRYESGMKRLRLTWTSDGSGDVNGTLSPVASGVILRVAFEPGAGGVQPTNLYDVTLIDSHGLDVLDGLGANLSNAAASEGVPMVGETSQPYAVDGPLELRVANAGATKSGTVTVYYA
jgi:hypothetical protein